MNRQIQSAISNDKPLDVEDIRYVGYKNGSLWATPHEWRSFSDVMRDTPERLTKVVNGDAVDQWLHKHYPVVMATGFFDGEYVCLAEFDKTTNKDNSGV